MPRNPPSTHRRSGQVRPEAVAQFEKVLTVAPLPEYVVERLRTLDEKSELEPHLMRIIGEVDVTPHGPTEIADQLTVHLEVLGEPRFAAVVTKGRASQRVRSKEVTHQLTRAAQTAGVNLLVLAAVGDIQDDVKRDLAFLAGDRSDWLVLDRGDLARLFAAYGAMCPRDGAWLDGGVCGGCGYETGEPSPAPRPRYTVLSMEDVSHALAKRFSANVLVPPELDRAATISLLGRAVEEVRRESYVRNEQVAAAHGSRLADVVWLFVYDDPAQQPLANWVCRAIWIEPALDRRWRPIAFGALVPDAPGLHIDWNESQPAIASLLEERRMTKGAYLRDIDGYLETAPPLIEQARSLLARAPVLNDPTERRLAELAERASGLPRPDASLVAPFELTALDDAFGSADAQLGNLFLPFGEQGRGVWDREARARIARMSLKYLNGDWAHLMEERRRVG